MLINLSQNSHPNEAFEIAGEGLSYNTDLEIALRIEGLKLP